MREFTEDETAKNRTFLRVSEKMAEMKYMLKTLTEEDLDSPHNRMVIKIGVSGISKIKGSSFATVINGEIEGLRKMREDVMPQWWKETTTK